MLSTPPLSNPWWQPRGAPTWQWKINNAQVDLSAEAEVYDIDLYADPGVIADLHARGRRVIGYISVGSWEDWRPDRDRFPAEVLGKDYEGWPGERWLDIRRIDLLAPILRARLDRCKASGFDAVEPDNMEIHTNDSGFPLTYADQLTFARWLAQEAHARGLAIGQKNAADMAGELVDLYDFAITEDCYAQGWGAQMLPYICKGKPVFAAEYTDTGVDFGLRLGQRQGLFVHPEEARAGRLDPDLPMKIIFSRHGESQANRLRQVSNRGLKLGLTQKGREQAAGLAGALAGRPIRRIYSSPLLRAIETTVIVAGRLELEYEVSEALREFDLGILEGRSDDACWRAFDELVADWLERGLYDRRIEGGESFNDIRARFVPFVEGLLRQYGESEAEILCVAHGGLYWVMLPLAVQNIERSLLERHGLGYTTRIVCELRAGRLVCVEWDDEKIF
jgi:broad specificity phosphatase PhoE